MFFVAELILIAGGMSGSDVLRSAEGLGTWSPPDIPEAQMESPLVAVGSRVFLCGGWSRLFDVTDKCYMLKVDDEQPTWKQVSSLPHPLSGHTGVAIGLNIWYVNRDKLYEYNTVKETTQVYTNMPFGFTVHSCAVANETHSHIVGAGRHRDEIWVNSRASNPTDWIAVAKIPIRPYMHSCILHDDHIYIQGGVTGMYPINNSFSVDIKTYTLRRLTDLKIPRKGARSLMMDGKPAVIGGSKKGDEELSSMEIYDPSKGWTLHEQSLITPRTMFGLVQISV